MNEDTITKKIEEIKKELDTFITDANKQVASYQGALTVLKSLLDPDNLDEDKE